ncbi:hypothetical protein, conserved [Eimeria necatrix]|uniref:Uncharacterized protein n=1 Tax=Eimeria necatrix TaxID=51315 RepID=U6MT18_9EIME|nr:hypothetical protein, conserved [Eimeria necatrix]CDJ65584.1 hypothetical protein, conserved [Eimeria necatrix]
MGCKPSTLGPHARDSAGAPAAGPAVADPSAGAPAAAGGASEQPLRSSASGSLGRGSLRLRLASLKNDMKGFGSPRQTLANSYDKLKRGASSLRQAITPRTTPGVSPRDEVTLEGPGGSHSIASDAIKEADNTACLDVAETKSQAVSGTMHTAMAMDGAAERRLDGGAPGTELQAVEVINRELPSPQQLKALWILMKINAAEAPQQSMQWLHDLEVLLVGLDPVERQQPTRNILVEAKALEICLKPLANSPEEIQLCVSSLAIIVHLCMAKEASERLLQLGGIDITAKVLKKYFSKAKKLLRDIPLMHVPPQEILPLAALEQQPQQHEQQQEHPQQPQQLLQHQQHPQQWTDLTEPPTPAPTPEGVVGENSNPRNGPSSPQQPPVLKGAAAAAEAMNSAPTESQPAIAETPLPTATPHTTPVDQTLSKSDTPTAAAGIETGEQAAAEAAQKLTETQAPTAAAHATATPGPAEHAEPAAAEPAAAAAAPETTTKSQGNGQIAALKRACTKLQQQLPLLLQQKLGTTPEIIEVTQEQHDLAVRELKLIVEFMTLVWRLVFATSLDGDEFAQRWATLGVPELAIEALASSEASFKENGLVCWGLGALRFIPLAVPSVAETYVHSKSLLSVAFDRMELYHSDPLVLENGFAVLANYQRKQPANSKLFSRQRPEAWGKCVSWLLEDESFSRIDVLFQGLFALGLACSYCPLAAKRVRLAGGLTLTERVLGASDELPREPSNSSTIDCKLATLQQFAEGLRLLLLRSDEADAAENAAAVRAEAAATLATADVPTDKAVAPTAEEKAAQAEHTEEEKNKLAEKLQSPDNAKKAEAVEALVQHAEEAREALEEAPKEQQASQETAEQTKNILKEVEKAEEAVSQAKEATAEAEHALATTKEEAPKAEA